MATGDMTQRLHATAVAIGGRGVLLRGASGAGKSDLALRLIDRGAVLIADDQVICSLKDAAVILAAPEKIAGLIEIRGLGLRRMPFLTAELALVIDLVPPDQVPRLPEEVKTRVCGLSFACFSLAAFDHSAPIKVEQALISRLDPDEWLR